LTHDGADATLDPPASYVLDQELESNTNVCYIVAHRILTASGVQAPQWITGGSRDYNMVAAAYKAAATGAQNQLAWITA